ncbi:hypothetical protein MTY_0703 [Moorella thermoacetica Y72]|uniref:Uncharacterized protein n=1 Tax=Moorella thermoacetica Y72 TaxID=1325331 RepID=A0A0S6U8S2_NEOTH|nr:hypothetical protein MTY_0703 [Moorella thermoacetica Y72]
MKGVLHQFSLFLPEMILARASWSCRSTNTGPEPPC